MPDKVIVSYAILPIRQTYTYSEINGITQEAKAVKSLYGASFKARYVFTDITTIIHLTDKKLKLNSIGQLDFDLLLKCFRKLKSGEGKCKKQKGRFVNYLLDNLDGLFFVLVCLFLTIGLGYGVFKQ